MEIIWALSVGALGNPGLTLNCAERRMVSSGGGPSMKRNSRPPAALPESIHRQLSKYAIAASAAGVGMIALTQAAEARIVYTPANIKIVENGGLISFDLNHDGIPDFGLSNI
jgi:hypothetical protein